MNTQINGKVAPWTPEIQAKWEASAKGRPEGRITQANYFTPRPYVDEYNAGSSVEGFTYTIYGMRRDGSESPYPEVVQVKIN